MLKKLRCAHPILFCLLAEALLVVFLQLGGVVSTLIMMIIGPVLGLFDLLVRLSNMFDAFSEMFGVGIAVFVLARTGRGKLLAQRGCGFFNGLLVGMWMLTITAYNLIACLANPPQGATINPLWDICWYFAYMFAVGVAEELTGRAVIAETLLEHFGTSRAGVWKASLLSGLIFGCGHLVNIIVSEPAGVLVQCGITAVMGVLITAIYYRTGNVWVVAFLHGINNVAASWTIAVYSAVTLGELVGGYTFAMLVPSALVYAIPAVFLLRKKKIWEIDLYFGKWCGTGC